MFRIPTTKILFVALAACGLLIGCTPTSGDDGGGAETADAGDALEDGRSGPDGDTEDAPDGPDVGMECVDCSDEVTCQDGMVTWIKGGGGCYRDNDVPSCDELQSGLSETYACEKGCRADQDFSGVVDQSTVAMGCEENRPKEVGDSCQDNSDCSPASDSQLECDASSNECVASG
jgi:hypothetical protein